ncbi:hypothetical protein FHV99_004679 [Ochrobactrum sp. P20RRXII]|nr:hypothetical protein [Ochrobactrum sp. P20RRXII]NIH77427.1 hypothetical protein [Ochrobactrum sp. P20RRXII]
MASSTKNVKLGACRVYYDGRDLGFTKGGVEFEVTTNTHDVTVDQLGETPISSLITGRTATVSVPMAETTLENLVAVMPGSVLVSDGSKSTGKITFAGEVADGDTVKIGDAVFTFRDVATGLYEVPVADDAAEVAAFFVETASEAGVPYSFDAVAGVVTVTAKLTGSEYNTAIAVTGTNITADPVAGGVAATKARVEVSSGVNINLLDVARPLRLVPIGTTGGEDLLIHRAGTPGAIQFAYQSDTERVFQASFSAFATEDGRLFDLGDQTVKAA